ncbi:Hypothetical protein EUBREC_3300 [Agathobacter rectalis ATCC 33656]|uniref:Uncharacterized protein n=1 Tax=Agathobacter rectalis (strain ATCC 33656 / DSM 3377 / JCM 17463 / KCTC 5835 / VPI 0990) TaxID=515619 RepID=C4ZDQ0_AGARV|nr:Hypothetical protein EUBREC_3300 [Agathobacter rectalis ATCC 33656]
MAVSVICDEPLASFFADLITKNVATAASAATIATIINISIIFLLSFIAFPLHYLYMSPCTGNLLLCNKIYHIIL